MTTTVNISSTGTSVPLTWDTASLAWNDPDASAFSWDVNGSGTVDWLLEVDETLLTTEGVVRHGIFSVLAEALGVLDAIGGRTLHTIFTEAFSVAAMFSRSSLWDHLYAESFGVSDARYVSVSSALNELLNILDVGSASFTSRQAETVALIDAYQRVVLFTRTFTESFATMDAKIGWSIGVNKSELFSTLDYRSVDFVSRQKEAFNVVDDYYRVGVFTRTYGETLNTVDARTAAVTTQAHAEIFTVRDTFLRIGPVVITDLVLAEEPLTFAEFQANIALGVPATFSEYVPFIAGDYQLTRADIKIVMTRENTSQDLRLVTGKVFVDVPDVSDRGTATLVSSAAPTYVAFNRMFIQPPEVAPGNVSASVFAVPRISGITKDGFYIELIDASNVRVTGTVSWNALGY